jgi:VanZ family protein
VAHIYKKIHYWLPPLIWMGVIFYFSSRQKISVADELVWNFIFFKTLHLLEYAFLFFLLFRAYKNIFKFQEYIWWGRVSFVTTVIYACTDELHQLFIPTREGRIRDVIIDALGAVLSWILINKLLPKLPAKLKNLV